MFTDVIEKPKCYKIGDIVLFEYTTRYLFEHGYIATYLNTKNSEIGVFAICDIGYESEYINFYSIVSIDNPALRYNDVPSHRFIEPI
jgi:hypothetical protein